MKTNSLKSHSLCEVMEAGSTCSPAAFVVQNLRVISIRIRL